MARKYDWGDGRGKVHSRPKRTRAQLQKAKDRKANANGGGGAKEEDSLYDIALKMAQSAFKPAIREATQAVAAAKQQAAPGGGADQAYDRSRDSIAASQQAAMANANAGAAQTQDAAGMGVAGSQQLGAEQAAHAQQQATLYGQTAKAAEEATTRAGAASSSLAGAGANQAGFLRALSVVQGNLGVAQTSANEARRGEARMDLTREVGSRRDALSDLRAQMSGQAQEGALEMQGQEREFMLALETLGQKEADSRRDFRATLRGIAEQRAQRQTNNQNADDDRATDDQNADADRLADHDMDGDGDIDARDKRIQRRHESSGAKGSGKGRYTQTVKVGPKGTSVAVTPSQKRQIDEKKADWQKYYDRAAALMRTGKHDNAEEARNAAGKKSFGDQLLWEIAWTARARRGTTSKTIPASYRSALRAMFPGGRIPHEIAKAIEQS